MITTKLIYDLVASNADTVDYGSWDYFSLLVEKLQKEGLLYDYGQVQDYDGRKKPYTLFGMKVRENKSIPKNEIHFRCFNRTLLSYVFPDDLLTPLTKKRT